MGGFVPEPEVVLVNSNRWKPSLAPIALDYLGAALEKNGISYEVFDACLVRNSARGIREFFADKRPKLVGITFRNLDDVLYGILFLDDLKGIVDEIKAASPESTIVLGGSGFSIAPEKILDYCGLDIGVRGEGEEALPLLVDCLGDVAAYPSVPGLVYRTDGGFVRNPSGSLSMDSFTLSGTSRKAIRRYCWNGNLIGSIGVQTKRGCDRRCSYCIVPNAEGMCPRPRPAALVAEEIEDAIKMGATRFFMADSEFNEPHDHAMEVCEEILRRGLEQKMTWAAYISCIEFSPELASLMRRAGCELAICSFDSACDDVLEKLHKRHRQADIVSTISAVKKGNLVVSYCLMIGGPGETLDTLNKTTAFLKGQSVKRVTLAEPPGVRIYPETPIADYVFNEGFDSKNPNLWGQIAGNEDLLQPVYYISSGLEGMRSLITGWRRLAMIYYRVFPRTRTGILRNRMPDVPKC